MEWEHVKKYIHKSKNNKSKNNKYRVTFYYGKNDEGKYKKEHKVYDSLKQAEKELKIFEGNKASNKIAKPTSETIESYAIRYLANRERNKEISKNTVYGYKIIINRLKKSIGDTKLAKLKVDDINKYIDDLKNDGIHTNTIIKHLAFLKQILNQAKDEMLISYNPANKIKKLKPEKKHVKMFRSIDDLKKVLEACKGDSIEVAIYLAAYLGLRRSEIVGLKWENVNFDKRYIHVCKSVVQVGKEIITKDPKTERSERYLGIPNELYEVLKKTKENQEMNKQYLGKKYKDYDLVYCKEDGSPYRPNHMSNRLKKIIERNKLPETTVHGIRHFYATLLVEDNVGIYKVSKVLGHTNTNTTESIYVNPLRKVDRDIPNAISQALSAPTEGLSDQKNE